MKSLWKETEAAECGKDLLALRVYTSRLIGQNENLVLHGGGNTSVKMPVKDFFGESHDVLYVKGSGWDLKTIEKAGFSPVPMDVLLKLAELKTLSDADMVKVQRGSMLDSGAPNPSVEAIMHAVIPYKFVDHTHADALITVTNNANGKKIVEEIYGNKVLVIPYVMPGFVLAKKIYETLKKNDIKKYEGLVLLNHGIFTFADDAKTSYNRMIELVTKAEDYLNKKKALNVAKAKVKELDKEQLVTLAHIRKAVSTAAGEPMFALLNTSSEAAGFASIKNVDSIAGRGPITPDHVIRTKPTPVVLDKDPEVDVAKYSANYEKYFKKNNSDKTMLAMLDTAPRWGVWKGVGTLAFDKTVKAAKIVEDISKHTTEAIQAGEAIGGWKTLAAKDIFDMEYWELEQAKLGKKTTNPEFQGKVFMITGAAAGIGLACANRMSELGAAVVALDLNPKIAELFNSDTRMGIVCNIADNAAMEKAVHDTVRRFGGLDMLVCNAGIFTAGKYIVEMEDNLWAKSMTLNLTSVQKLLQFCIPFMKHGIDPAVVLVGSRNVHAPGPGASAYSVAKAGLTQLGRVASMELAVDRIRVNMIHPDAVFDTDLWTPEVLERSAKRYGMTVQEYKTKNLMKVEIKSADVGNMICTMLSKTFLKTTGAQIPIDGGNDRII